MSLAEEMLVPFLRMPDQLNDISKEINNVMSKVTELQDAVNEMKQTLADEASELFDKVDELQAQIDAKVDPSSLDPVIADIRGSIENIEALSEGRPAAPAEPMPAEEPAMGGETSEETGGGTEMPSEPTPADGGAMTGDETNTPTEVPSEPAQPAEPMPFPTEEAPAEPVVEEPVVEQVPADSGASTGTETGNETGFADGSENTEATTGEGGTGSDEEPTF